MSQIDEIRDKIDIVELIGSMGVALRKTGRSFVGFCPFHPNTRTPAGLVTVPAITSLGALGVIVPTVDDAGRALHTPSLFVARTSKR